MRVPVEGELPTTDYGSFFQLSLDMLCTAGFDGRFKDVNRAFGLILGYGREELLAQPYIDLVHPEDWHSTLAVAAELASGRDVVAFENRYRHKDGSYRWLNWSARSDVQCELIYCAAKDVTDSRERDATISVLLAELERSNTDLAQFAYAASHDLSEPLRMVSSYVQLIADRYKGQLDADADEFIAFAVDGAARMKLLIDDLLAYSRAGGTAAPRRPVDCGELVSSALSDLDRVLRERDAIVVIEELPTLDADPAQLAQIFHNLLTNAIKFVAPDVQARVRVSADRMDRSWCFSVADNGIGIAEEHRERIFLMFKRLHGRSEYPGTGIGLALCHKIIGRLGGRIWVESTPGHGSVFRFTVPDVPAPEAVTPAMGS